MALVFFLFALLALSLSGVAREQGYSTLIITLLFVLAVLLFMAALVALRDALMPQKR